MGEPTWLREIEAPMTLAQLEAARRDRRGQSPARERPAQNPVRGELEEMIETKPEQASRSRCAPG